MRPPQPFFPDTPWLTQVGLVPGILDVVLGLLYAVLLMAAAFRWRYQLAAAWGWGAAQDSDVRQGEARQGAAWVVPVLALHLLAGVFMGYPMSRLSSSHGDSTELYRSARHLYHHLSQHPEDLGPLLWRDWGSPADEALIDRTLYDQGGVSGRYLSPEQGHVYLSLVDNRQAWRLVLVLALLLPLAGGAYYPLALLVSAIGALATWALAQVLLGRCPPTARAHLLLRAAVLLCPSALLWGSGLLKEPWVLAGIAAALVLADRLARGTAIRLWPLIGLLALVLFALRIKPYPLLLWMGLLALWVLLERRRVAVKGQWKWMLTAALFVYLLAAAIALHQIAPVALMEAATSRLHLLSQGRVEAPAGSWVDIGVYDLTLLGALLKAPAALRATLFGPLPWQAHGLSQGLLATESFLYLVVIVALLMSVRWRGAWGSLGREPLIGVLLAFALGYAVVLGLSVSNYGSLARYRVVCVPLLLGALVLCRAHTHQRVAAGAAPLGILPPQGPRNGS